jgi:hypothetical protein
MQDYSYSPPPVRQESNGLAVASLVSSILGLTLIPTIGSIIGLILGYMARNKIRDSAGAMGGEGLAKAGIIVGWIGIGLAAIGICIALIAIIAGVGIPGLAICAGGLGNY